MEKQLFNGCSTAGLGKYHMGDYGWVGHCTTLNLRMFCIIMMSNSLY